MKESTRKNYAFLSMLTLSVSLMGCSETESPKPHQQAEKSGLVTSSQLPEKDELSDSPQRVELLPDNVQTGTVVESSVSEVSGQDSDADVYAGEEFFASDSEFSPKVQEAIDAIEGQGNRLPEDKPLKPEYQELADVLESQIEGS